MASTISIGNDKTPSAVASWRSDGDTIPVVSASGGEAIGDVIVRTAAVQAIGVITAVAPDNPSVATAGDEMEVRLVGMFNMLKATGALADGARVLYHATNGITADATGAHEVVGGYASGDTRCLVRINVFPGAATA